MASGALKRKARAYAALLTKESITRRGGIALGIFRDHQFERTSPLAALPDELRDRILDREVVLPPPRLLNVEGGQTTDGLLFLASLAKALDAKVVFEIGTYKGVTSWTLARNLDSGVVHTLDLPFGERANLDLSELDEANRRHEHERLFERLTAPARVEQHWGDSATFDFSPFAGICDLVYIDGAHTRAYVESDTQNALTICSDKGAIVWDDYWRQEPGVSDVLHSLALSPTYRIPGTRLVVHPRDPSRLG